MLFFFVLWKFDSDFYWQDENAPAVLVSLIYLLFSFSSQSQLHRWRLWQDKRPLSFPTLPTFSSTPSIPTRTWFCPLRLDLPSLSHLPPHLLFLRRLPAPPSLHFLLRSLPHPRFLHCRPPIASSLTYLSSTGLMGWDRRSQKEGDGGRGAVILFEEVVTAIGSKKRREE